MDEQQKFKRTVAIASAILGSMVGLIGIKGFFSGNPKDFIYFFFFISLVYLRVLDKRLAYLGLIGVAGAAFAILAINGYIKI